MTSRLFMPPSLAAGAAAGMDGRPVGHGASSAAAMIPAVARPLAIAVDSGVQRLLDGFTRLFGVRIAIFDSAWNEALAARPPRIQPEAHEVDGERILCYPGDPLHSVPGRALHGPTRLRWLNRRFEPLGGFDSWFE